MDTVLELQEKPKEKPSSRLPLIVGGLMVLAVVLGGGGLWWSSKHAKEDQARKYEGFLRAGSPEFDAYLRGGKLAITKLERFESNSMIGWRYDIQCQLENLGQRTITGVELRGFVVNFEDKPFVERLTHPVPNQRATLKPGEVLPVRMVVDGVKDSAEVMDVRVEVRGLRFGG